MSDANGGSAFPSAGSDRECPVDGMSIRDYFAAKAMQEFMGDLSSICRPRWLGGLGYTPEQAEKHISECAYDIADAMLRARK